MQRRGTVTSVIVTSLSGSSPSTAHWSMEMRLTVNFLLVSATRIYQAVMYMVAATFVIENVFENELSLAEQTIQSCASCSSCRPSSPSPKGSSTLRAPRPFATRRSGCSDAVNSDLDEHIHFCISMTVINRLSLSP